MSGLASETRATCPRPPGASVARLTVASAASVSSLVGIGSPCGSLGRVSELGGDPGFELLGEDVLEPVGLVMDLVPGDVEVL